LGEGRRQRLTSLFVMRQAAYRLKANLPADVNHFFADELRLGGAEQGVD
jgi:hypothetical protein